MRNVAELVLRAKETIRSYDARQAIARFDRPDVVFVDVRDDDEIRKSGRIAGSIHTSRGMLEFCIAEESAFHLPVFATDREFIFYCGDGRRSALAARAASDLGLTRVANLDGGFDAWQSAGGGVERAEYLRPIRFDELATF